MGGLVELSHGTVKPCVVGRYNYRRARFKGGTESERKICWHLMRHSRHPYLGYFEFVISKTGRLRFVDYKVNEMYLK